MKKVFFSVVLLLVSFVTISQKNKDYYLKIIDTTTNINLKLAALDSLSNDYKNPKDLVNFANKAEEFVDLALDLKLYNRAAKKATNAFFYINIRLGQRDRALRLIERIEYHISHIKDSSILGKLYLKKGGGYFNGKDYNKAINNYSLAIEYLGSRDSIFVADAIFFKGQAYFDKGETSKALDNYKLAVEYYEALGDKYYVFYAKGEIISIYGINGLKEKSIQEYKNLIQEKLDENFIKGIEADYYNLANNYLSVGDSISYKNTILKALEYNKINKNSNNNITSIYSSLAKFYAYKNNLLESKKYLELGKLKLESSDINTYNYAALNKAESIYYLKSKKLNKALLIALQNLKHEKKWGRGYGVKETNKILSEIYTQKGDLKKALKYYKDFIAIKDSIYNSEKTASLNYYQTLFELEQQEKEIATQKNAIELLNKENKHKQRLIISGNVSFLLISIILFLYVKRTRLKRKKKIKEEYAQNLLFSQEEERKRVAKDLHDGLGQSLLLIKNRASDNQDKKIKELVNNAINEIRGISKGLHPFQLKEIGLSKALNNLISQLDENYKSTYIFGDIDDVEGILDTNQEVNIFRIIQECLSNIIKHAKADSARVALINKKHNVYIYIKDNGTGFNFSEKYNDSKSLGLKTIKERVRFLKGTFQIDSFINEGTNISIKIPKLHG